MNGDFTRDTFDPRKHFSRVLMQQGRVQLDADWNEQSAILLDYLRTLARDILGPAAGPADGNSRGFEIITNDEKGGTNVDDKIRNIERDETRRPALSKAVGDGGIVIGPGHYYVEGALVKNERAILYTEQLGIGSSNQPEDLSRYKNLLFYLDVWERYISYIQDDAIREKALGGPDTCARSKVVWQVKVLSGDDLSCDSLDIDAEGKRRLPSLGGGKLRARARKDDSSTDELCTISPESRYRGAENQLYRVEVHRGGKATGGKTGATFKWSRENGCATFPVRQISNGMISLENLGRDQHATLSLGDWVELVDDRIAMGTYSGPLARVEEVKNSELSITVSLPEETGLPSYSATEIERLHPFLRRWDHPGDVALASGGALPISETDPSKSEAGWLELEDGIQIQFVKDKDDDLEYRAGDYWLIPARVATGDVEWPDELEPDGTPKLDRNHDPIHAAIKPQGPRHYYAPLYLSGTEKKDCRCAAGKGQGYSGSEPAYGIGKNLKKGWLRMPFRPTAIPPSKNTEPPPPFRVGATETRAHTEFEGTSNTRGAAGTMAIPLPPGISHIHRLRVAGHDNAGKIDITLYRGGWNPDTHEHVGSKDDKTSKLVEECIENKGPYDKTYEIKEGDLDLECSTVSIDVRSTGYCMVSLVAVEIS